MTTFRKLKALAAGASLSDFSARELRELAQVADTIANMKAVHPLRLAMSPGRMILSLDDSFRRSIPQDRTVVIVAPPQENSVLLTVRKVRYADRPPKPCEDSGDNGRRVCYYEYDGASFDAYVAIGHEATDYADNYHDPITPLTLSTPFLNATNRDGYWMVEQPPSASGISLAVVRAVIPLTTVITVQRVSPGSIDSDGAPIYEAVGEPFDTLTWPNTTADDFAELVYEGDVASTAVIIALHTIDGVTYASQTLRWRVKARNMELQRGGC